MFCFLFGEKRKNMVKETNVDVKEKTLEAVEAASKEATEKDIELHLKPSEAEIIKDLLSHYVYAYRSDNEEDCKRELVEKDKVGLYPYPSTDPTPGLIQPAYDWVNNVWYDKSKEGLSQLYQRVDKLDKNSVIKDKQLSDIQASINQSNETSATLIAQVNAMGDQFGQAFKELGTAINSIKGDQTNTKNSGKQETATEAEENKEVEK